MSNKYTLEMLQAKYQKPALTPNEVATELGISIEDMLAAVADSTIPAKRVGPAITFPLPIFAAFLDGDATVFQPTDSFQERLDTSAAAELSYHTPKGEGGQRYGDETCKKTIHGVCGTSYAVE